MVPQKNCSCLFQNIWATYLLIAVSTVSLTLSASSDLFQAGALVPAQVWKGEVWRLFTASFIHTSFVHCAFNVFVLFQVGSRFEPVIGGLRFLFLYLISGAAGFALSLLLHPVSTDGSSGAVFGVIGGLLGAMLNLPSSKIDKSALRALILFVILNLLLSVIASEIVFPGIRIDSASHLAGLFFGLVFGFVFITETPYFLTSPQTFRDKRKRLTGFALGFGLLAFFTLLILSMRPQASQPILSFRIEDRSS